MSIAELQAVTFEYLTGAAPVAFRDHISIRAVNDDQEAGIIIVRAYQDTGTGAVEAYFTYETVPAQATYLLDITIPQAGNYWVRIQVTSEFFIPHVMFLGPPGSLPPFLAYGPGDFAIFALQPVRRRVLLGTGPVRGISDTDAGVFGESNSGNGVLGSSQTATGVLGISSQSIGVGGLGNDVGIFGAGGNLAGWFLGNVSVSGSLTKSGGGFSIDHPLDPANKYLHHAFVESPEMKNVYDGIVVLDANGEAVVDLPDWFDALNQEFRYQLTPLGAPGPHLYIAEEISTHRFKIAGGLPAMKVCWQVTGIRQDAWAQANRLPVEQDKAADEKGHYLHPEVHGQASAKNIVEARYPELLRQFLENQQQGP